MNKSDYEFEGEPFIPFFFMLLIGTVLGCVIMSFIGLIIANYYWVPYFVSFLGLVFFIGNLIRWVYHNIGYHGRNVVIAGIFAFLIFFWYGVGQELGGRSYFINLFN